MEKLNLKKLSIKDYEIRRVIGEGFYLIKGI